MIYLLDANATIDANRDYYPMQRVPEFWAWLEHQGREGNVKIPVEIFEEIKVGRDDLGAWARRDVVVEALLLEEEPSPKLVRQVLADGYAADLDDTEIERVGKDPFLIAYALVSPSERCVVSTERSRPGRQRANRHVPDVCNSLGVNWRDVFGFIRELDFTTSWARRQ